ncbi:MULTISPECIES: AAA family ATPase [Curtobacterium]|uniref:AAA family ATPase n=1 Tax=Curtobacterium TaxID=2034 RepID=UPI00188A6CC7|nr:MULTISPECIES: ATP-binding protein [Curtobacterium]MBF4588701.1 ATP-binding protein [Curtobacterium sp. VKM Ac-1395]MBY0175481.1 ATP-binding protein [Curtobacterium herbarum]
MAVNDLGPAELALVDVVRVALTGDVDGVQQLCRRYIRRPPTAAGAAAALKEQLVATVSAAPARDESPLRGATSTTLRYGAATAPGSQNGWLQWPEPMVPPVYSEWLNAQIESLIREHQSPDLLTTYGLSPSRAVLFTGPPGVGKSLSAGYIATRLGLPLLTVNIASIMSSLMGRTGQNLQEVLLQAAEQPMVLFLDEFDALAKSRDDSGDVGEVRRVVNVILQQLDRWPVGGLLVAATNHPQLLDPAVHRRFDLTLTFSLPTLPERAALVRSHPIALREGFPEETVQILAIVTEGFSQADLDNWIRRTVRQEVVGEADREHAPNISAALMFAAGESAQAIAKRSAADRTELARLTKTALGWTNRRIATWLGVSHPTIGTDITGRDTAHRGEGGQHD